MSNSTLPPQLPSKPQKSFYHQAATASAFAPLIAIGLNIASSAGRTGADPQSQRTVAFIVGIVGTVILVIGLICGIVALFGIGNHGTNGILGKALFGIIIPLLCTALLIPSFMAARSRALHSKQNQPSVEQQLRVVVNEINKQGNRMIDEVTRLEGAEALPNRTLLYKYSLITKSSSEIPLDAINRIVRPNLVKTYNTLPNMKLFRDNGVTITYRYMDKAGELIGDISVGPGDLTK
jgi:hypothetical protein